MQFVSGSCIKEVFHDDCCRAAEYTNRTGESFFVVRRSLEWYVLAFNKNGYCTHVETSPSKQVVWRFFIDLINEDMTTWAAN